MKNGVNVAGVSELMHEIRDDSAQGVFAYDAEAQWTGGDSLLAFVNSAMIGSVKSSRSFQWRVTLAESASVSDVSAREMVFTPEELALTGLGACAMLTMVKGATTCGRNIQSLQFLVKGKHYPAVDGHPAVLADFDYRVEFDAESEEDNHLFSEVLKKLSNHSPNHRTIVERNTVSVPNADLQVNTLNAVAIDRHSELLQVEMNWEYGFQLHVSYDDVRYTRVDQPKQAGGIDKGANPQEILMSAFAACLSRTFIQLMAKEKLSLNGVKVQTKGHVDMRGMLGIDPSIPSKLQSISVDFFVDSPASKQTLDGLILKAIEQSPITRLIIEPQQVNLHLHRQSAQIIAFVSKGE
ncbi:MAG: OsmC family protein [Pseudomonadota bacterium]